MSKTTKIANRDVPIQPGGLITVHFSGGRAGKSEAGTWEFWTVFNNKKEGTVARCRPGSDPGERFRRMEGEKEYEQFWKIAAAAEGIRPARPEEVIDWLNDHPKDAPFAESCQVGDRTMRVVKTEAGFRFE